jgi:hypothetical protein
MNRSKIDIIEETILEITNVLLKEWEEKFREISVCADVPIINRNNSESDYFSEIEFNFWHESNLITSCSIVIYMENKQVLEIDEAKKYIQKEIRISYDECINSRSFTPLGPSAASLSET